MFYRILGPSQFLNLILLSLIGSTWISFQSPLGTRSSPLGSALALGSHPSSGPSLYRGSGPFGLSVVLLKRLEPCCGFVALVALIFCKGLHIVGFDAVGNMNWELSAAKDTSGLLHCLQAACRSSECAVSQELQ